MQNKMGYASNLWNRTRGILKFALALLGREIPNKNTQENFANRKFVNNDQRGAKATIPISITAFTYWAAGIVLFLLLGAIPFLGGPGLTEVTPMGKYLNGKFPSRPSSPLPYKVAFPNLSFDSPLTFAMHPTQNKIVIGQRDGKIYWFEKNANTATKQLLLDLSHEVGVVWDGGFLGLALHPEFGTGPNNYFYTYYSTKDANGNDFPDFVSGQNCDSEQYWGNYLTLARFEVALGTMDVIPNSKTTLIKVRMYGTTHRGGGLLFGNDGFLYLTTGDQTAFKKAQDIKNNLDGGVLRMDVDKNPAKSHAPIRTMPEDHGYADEISGNGYWIPNDNPFLSANGENFEEYYSMGHRNPHRMTMDTATGKLYIGEIGENKHEEINVIAKGKNYGWPVYEGNSKDNLCGDYLYNNMPHERPLVAFPRADANAIIGGFVYRGTKIPNLYGKYICGDYGFGEEIWSVDVNTGEYTLLGNFTPSNIISFGQDDEGEIYILKLGEDNLYTLAPTNTGQDNIPQWLSQTGAFDDLIDLKPAKGVIPYDMIESFWSDGAVKKRWMAIPNDGNHDTAEEQIAFSENDIWIFPVGSVLIKHFEIPVDERDPSKTKRLETRFSIKGEDGNFYFATYKWNAAQTNARLLGSGLDEDIGITRRNGTNRTQTWHYPSTSECLSCHNAVSGGSLGTRTRYLNNSITYSETGITANQLVTLSHLGILDEEINDGNTQNYLTHTPSFDSGASIEDRARSYLDLNCAYCHRPGTGNRGEFDLRLINSLEETGLLTAGANESLGIDGESILSPGDATKSILYHRVNSLNANIMMPPLAKNKIDDNGAALIQEWIDQLDPKLSDTVNEGLYVIRSKASGKALDIAGSGLANGTNVQQWEYAGMDNQHFYVKADIPGHYTIRASHSDKYVDVAYAGQAPGTNVWQWQGNGTDAQQWKFLSTGDGYYHIVSKVNGLYLDLDNISMANGANIKVWTNNGLDAQKWKLEPVDTQNTQISEGMYYLQSKASGKVLDITGASLADGANVQQWEYSGIDSQHFYIEKDNTGYNTIRASHSDKYMDVAYAGQAPGTNVWQWQGGGTDAQQWKFLSIGDGYYHIVSKVNGLYLDLDNISMANGANIKVWTNNGLDAQKWKPVAVDNITAKVKVKRIEAGPTPNFLVFPNPSRLGQPLVARYEAAQKGNMQLSILNTIGQTVRQENIKVDMGTNEITIATDQLPSGMYFVSVRMENKYDIKSIIVY